MKNKRFTFLMGILAILLLQFAVVSSHAQIIATNGNTVILNNFDTTDQVYVNQNLGGASGAWANWYGFAFSNVVWSPSDAGAPGDNPGSGSMLIQSYFPNGGNGQANYGSQFLCQNGFGTWSPPFDGYGTALTNVEIVTNFTCDIRFDPISATNGNGTFPTVEFGTYGNDPYNAHDFGSITLQATNTNWVHVSIPLAAQNYWTNITEIYVKIFSTLGTDPGGDVPEYLYVDNLEFQLGIPAVSAPNAYIQKAPSALRIFANGPQYARTQIGTVDTNQSWVGGTYPVSYSFNISGFDNNIAVNEFHAFWLPLNWVSGALNQFSDYSTASNSLRLLITEAAAGNPQVVANLTWKTNLLNSNGTNIEVQITNSTIVGTWTVTFTSATGGTLTAPGASPAAFTIGDANIAADFGNPSVFELGMQPDPTTSIGSYVDVTHVQTTGVTGVPVNENLTTGSINTNDLLTGSISQTAAGLVPVSAAVTPYWVYWSTPAIGFSLGTKADIGNKTIAWKTPNFYAGYPTNGPTVPLVLAQGAYDWELIPAATLPTVDGTSNGVVATKAFYSLQNPAPAQ